MPQHIFEAAMEHRRYNLQRIRIDDLLLPEDTNEFGQLQFLVKIYLGNVIAE